ncbi:MAG: hypothetical protein ACI9OJ_000796 [Myxococcota bacterium]
MPGKMHAWQGTSDNVYYFKKLTVPRTTRVRIVA